MSTNILTKSSAFTIADADISTHESVTYVCTGAFAITIPSTGVTAGNEFYIISEDGLQTFVTTGATVDTPAERELVPYANSTGESASISILCLATGSYKVDGDLNPTDVEAGTWTPTLDSGATTTPDATTDGTYTKIGKLIVAQFTGSFSTITLNGTAIKVGGLPYTAAQNTAGTLGHVARAQYTSGNHHYIEVLSGTSVILFKKMAGSAGNSTDLLSQSSGTYGPGYRFSITYTTA